MDSHYVAMVYVPGYLPQNDPTVWSTPAEAWRWLADERRRDENADWSQVIAELDARAQAADGDLGCGPGRVYGDTPGRGGGNDVGLVYSVAPVTAEQAADIRALQDCC